MKEKLNERTDFSYTDYQRELVEEKSNYLYYTREELINKLIDYLSPNNTYRNLLLYDKDFTDKQSLSELRNRYSKLINRLLRVSRRIRKSKERRGDRNDYYGFCTE